MRRVLCGFAVLMLSAGVSGRSQSDGGAATIPDGASMLQGSPSVRVETTVDETKRYALTAEEADAQRLRINVKDGRYVWTSRQGEALTVRRAGEFVYLMTANPGQYVRLRRINDRLTYVEHLDTAFGSVTYFGELRVELGK